MKNIKILLAEDDPNLGMVVREFLISKAGYDVVLCRDGVEAMETFKEQNFDLCILDVMMPQKDGFTLGREIRSINKNIPILFATAKAMLDDKKEGFGIGADDYITKPFSMDELIMRVEAVMRRVSDIKRTEEQQHFLIGKFEFDPRTQVLIHGKEQRKLTAKESEMLEALCEKTNQTVKREDLLLRVWHDDSYFNGRSMDVYLSKLRKYLSSDPSVEIITLHGSGYKLIVPHE